MGERGLLATIEYGCEVRLNGGSREVRVKIYGVLEKRVKNIRRFIGVVLDNIELIFRPCGRLLPKADKGLLLTQSLTND